MAAKSLRDLNQKYRGKPKKYAEGGRARRPAAAPVPRPSDEDYLSILADRAVGAGEPVAELRSAEGRGFAPMPRSFGEAGQRLSAVIRGDVEPTPEEERQINAVRGFAEGPASIRAVPARPLVAIHNTSPEKLEKMGAKGDVAVAPSIAVTRADQPYDPFGSISLVAPPATVNPSRTPVYARDAYTPRYPRVETRTVRGKEREVLPYINENMANWRYLPDTPENALRLMKKEPWRGGEGWITNNWLLGQLAPQFKTMSELKEARGRIVPSSDKTTENWLNELNKLHSEWVNAANTSGQRIGFDFFDNLQRNLAEAMQRGESGMEKINREYYGGLIPEDLLRRTREFLQTGRELPTTYFEAKPRRLVPLSEFEGAVIPADTPDEIRKILERNYIKSVLEYSNPQERTEQVGRLRNLFFSGAPLAAAGLSDLDEKYADGGMVREPATAYDPDEIDRIVQEFAEGGEVNRELMGQPFSNDYSRYSYAERPEIDWAGGKRPLNVQNLYDLGAFRFAHWNGDPSSLSLVSYFNDSSPDSVTTNWPTVSRERAQEALSSFTENPWPLYTGKYNQIVDSARRLGISDEDIFLPQNTSTAEGFAEGGEVEAPAKTYIGGQEHKLAYITDREAALLKARGGSGRMTKHGIRAYDDGDGDGPGGGAPGDPGPPDSPDPPAPPDQPDPPDQEEQEQEETPQTPPTPQTPQTPQTPTVNTAPFGQAPNAFGMGLMGAIASAALGVPGLGTAMAGIGAARDATNLNEQLDMMGLDPNVDPHQASINAMSMGAFGRSAVDQFNQTLGFDALAEAPMSAFSTPNTSFGPTADVSGDYYRPMYGSEGYGMNYGRGYAHGGLAKLHQKYAEGGEVEDDGGVERYDPREIDALASEFMAESNPADLMQRTRMMMRGMNVGMPSNVGALNLSDNENVSTYTGLREMPIEDDRFARALRTLNTGINATLDQERGIRLGAGLQALQDAGDRGMSGYGANLSAGYGPVSLHGGYQSQLQAYPGAKPQEFYTYGGNLNIPLDDEGAKALLGAQVMSGRRGSVGAGNAGTLITGGLERPFRGGTLGVDVSVDPTLRNKEILFGYRRAF